MATTLFRSSRQRACATMFHEMSAAPMPALDSPGADRIRRFVEGTAAVAVWMALGLVLHTSPETYLLLGILITIGFQRYVRRAPLRALWVRQTPPFHLGASGVAIAILLTIKPLTNLVISIRSHEKLAVDAWLLAAIMAEAAFALAGSHEPAWSELRTALASFLLFVPVVFLLEEVWFRCVLDSHLHHPGETRGALSAIYVSALWGIWHYPITPEPHRLQDLLPTLAYLLVVHILIGVPFSWSWRRSGNLFVPGSVHALIDAVRDAMIALPG
jgi:membrane protease YdiL (CAAX protease family)